jgi:hypothetical protein
MAKTQGMTTCNKTQGTSHHPSICLSIIKFEKTLMVNKKCVHNLGFRVSLDISLKFQFKIAFVKDG